MTGEQNVQAPAGPADGGVGNEGRVPVDPAAAAAGLRRLFATLVPPEVVVVRDVFNQEHRVRGVLPARAQIAVIQELEALMGVGVDSAVLADLQRAGTGADGVTGLIGQVVRLAREPRVLDGLERCFALAHPQAVQAAAAEAIRRGGEEQRAADLFPVEELVAGLVPFCIRLIARLLDLMGSVGTLIPPTTSAGPSAP